MGFENARNSMPLAFWTGTPSPRFHLHVGAEKVLLRAAVRRLIPHGDRFSCRVSTGLHLECGADVIELAS